MKRYAFLLFILLIVGSCVASITEPTTPPGALTVTWSVNSGPDIDTIIAPVTLRQKDMLIYYVATEGNDSNVGTEARPFRTIQKGVDTAQSGDMVYVKQGVYHEQVVINDSIIVQSYPGEIATLDGQKNLPGPWNYLLKLSGDNISVTNLEVKNSDSAGVGLMGNYNEVSYLNVHHSGSTGIYAAGDHNLIADNTVWWNSDDNEYGTSSGWGGGIALGHGTNYNIARSNTVYNNWGEGILSMRRSEYAIIEQNIVYDNWSVNVYGNGSHVTIQRNLVYATGDTRFYRSGRPATGIALCDETEYVSHHKTIINNLVVGCNRAFYYFIQQEGAGLKNALIAHNTFANSDLATTFQISAGEHEDVRIENNIFVQDDDLPIAVVIDDPNLGFSRNLWSKAPPTAAADYNQIIGNPHLTKSGLTGPGLLTPDWFRLLPGSPAIDTGIILSQVPCDFDGVTRPQGAGYDIGAYESPYSTKVTDLRVIAAVGDTHSLTVTLRWTTPFAAITYTLRSSNTLLTAANWSDASIVTVPFTASKPGSSEWLTTPIEHAGGTLYLALKSQNSVGIWSKLSNTAFWPGVHVYLPLVMKDYVPLEVKRLCKHNI